MDKHLERERLQTQCLRLSKYAALLREADTGPEQRALQCVQTLALVDFLSMMQESALRLLEAPEEAGEIAEENLERIYTFLDQYTRLMEEEYSLYRENPPEP